ncbi:hypothetical protein [Mesoterricola sediminis]|uniref:hypothetical protein n=1 Tax=Mesoterricola sediminis TaxID=2927980 RepID=UPI001FAF6871|nr:hypothetical protein [Mesoterricola sediminis]
MGINTHVDIATRPPTVKRTAVDNSCCNLSRNEPPGGMGNKEYVNNQRSHIKNWPRMVVSIPATTALPDASVRPCTRSLQHKVAPKKPPHPEKRWNQGTLPSLPMENGKPTAMEKGRKKRPNPNAFINKL